MTCFKGSDGLIARECKSLTALIAGVLSLVLGCSYANISHNHCKINGDRNMCADC